MQLRAWFLKIETKLISFYSDSSRSEISPTEKDRYHLISLIMWNLKNKTETESLIQRTNRWLPEGPK